MNQISKSELTYWLAFYLCKGLGVNTLLKLQQQIPLDQLIHLTATQLIELGLNQNIANSLVHTNWQQIEIIIQKIEQFQVHVFCYFTPGYPELLKQITTAPILLFCRGQVELLKHPQIAIVGSRNATPCGLKIAQDISQQLTQNDIVVTSGLAIGIDGAAHKGALSGSGKTIAVLGNGIDTVYPKRHQALAEQILDTGLIISEFLPGTKPQAKNFPRRNRIISGLSLGTLVVEAELKSGSLITARYALEHNREVFAIPGSIFNRLSQGSHYLIKQGAKLVENVNDILEEVSIFPKTCLYINKENIDHQEEDPVLKQLGYEVTPVDLLVERTKIPIQELMPLLLDFELEGKVERVTEGYIKLRRN